MKILVADDDDVFRLTVSRQVQSWGHAVIEARSGDEAHALTLHDPAIGVAIVDRQMPLMDGLELCRRLRSERSLMPYIIVVTAYDTNGDILEALECGADDYIRKPFLPAELKARLNLGVRTATLHRELIEACRTSQLREGHIRSLLDSTGEGIYGVDRDGRCTFVNTAAAKKLGYSANELLGRDMHEAIHSKDIDGSVRRREECPVAVAMQTGAAQQEIETVLWTSDQNWFRARYSVNPMIERGAIGGAVVVFNDITREIQARERLLQAARLEAVGRLAGGVAHEFNNTLMTISANAELLKPTLQDDSPEDGYCNQIVTAAERAAFLTSHLLAFSAKQLARPETLNLDRCIREELDILRPLIGEDVTIVYEAVKETPCVLLDRSQLSHILMSLALNARDALPCGGTVTIDVGCVLVQTSKLHKEWIEPGEYVVVCVADDGPGVATEVLDHIFEPFYGIGDGRNTGLGLATVFGIVKQNGGHIICQSATGRGTRFSIYFPAYREATLCPSLPHTAKISTAIATTQGQSTAVLLVEDEEALRRSVGLYLRRFGFRVREASNSKDALDVIRSGFAPAVVISDVVMPGGSGIDLANDIARSWPDVKIILVSGYADAVIDSQGITPAASRLLHKPYKLQTLVSMISEILPNPA